MTASPAFRDGPTSALDGGGGWADAMKSLDIREVGESEPIKPMASVTEIHPATINADTDPNIPVITAEKPSATKTAERSGAADRPDFTQPVPAPVVAAAPRREQATIRLAPVRIQPKPAAAAPAPSVPPPQLSPAESPSTVDSDELRFWGEDKFHWVYRLVICIGLVGQVLGFGELFGGHVNLFGTVFSDFGAFAGNLPPFVAAAVIGGGFELIMVTFGDKALGMYSREYTGKEWGPFMAVASVAAVIASAMNVIHWKGVDPTMAAIFGGLAILGFIGHITDGFVRGGRKIAARKRERDEAARRRQEAEEAERKRREAEEAEAARRRQEAEAERQRQQIAEANRELIEQAERILAKRPKKGTKATIREARALGVYHEVNGAAELTKVLDEAGFTVPPRDTVKTWWREVRQRLSVTAAA